MNVLNVYSLASDAQRCARQATVVLLLQMPAVAIERRPRSKAHEFRLKATTQQKRAQVSFPQAKDIVRQSQWNSAKFIQRTSVFAVWTTELNWPLRQLLRPAYSKFWFRGFKRKRHWGNRILVFKSYSSVNRKLIEGTCWCCVSYWPSILLAIGYYSCARLSDTAAMQSIGMM